MNNILYGILAAVLIISIAIFTNFDLKKNYQLDTNKCNPISTELRFSCYKSEIEKYSKGDPNFINQLNYNNSSVFKVPDKSYAIFGTNCHTFYHALGDFIAENISTSDSNISYLLELCTTSCTSGCMMGLYKRTALKNNFSTSLLKDLWNACREEEKNDCAHEIGHILHDKYTYSILKILDEISYKEYGLEPKLNYSYVTFSNINLTAPFEECKEIVQSESGLLDRCFTGVGHNLFIFSEFSEEGFKGMFDECAKIEEPQKTNCLAFLIFRIGINEVAPRFLSYQFEEGNKICNDVINMSGRGDLEFHCYTGLGGGIGLYIDSEYDLKITEENVIQIKKTLLGWGKLCEKVETAFIENCYAGLFGTKFKKFYEELDIYDENIESIIPKLGKDFVVVG